MEQYVSNESFSIALELFFVRLVRSLSSLSWVSVAMNSVSEVAVPSLLRRQWWMKQGCVKPLSPHSRTRKRSVVAARGAACHHFHHASVDLAVEQWKQSNRWTRHWAANELNSFAFSFFFFVAFVLWHGGHEFCLLSPRMPWWWFSRVWCQAAFLTSSASAPRSKHCSPPARTTRRWSSSINRPTDRSINQLKISTQVNPTVCSSTLL